MDIKSLWGNSKFDCTISESISNSGGILCVWDPSVFCKENHIISDNFIALYGSWVSKKLKLLMISIYAPQSFSSKRILWNYISNLIGCWDGYYMVMRGFNKVRCVEDRFGSEFNAQSANEFNCFISNSGLIEIQLEEPVEILDREFKKLKRSRITIVKVRWNSKRGLDFTWEREDQLKLKYPYLFSDISG
nr:RNA-directed DNA polymerase, eukaryota [Tanacetum cinerariifolium]